ncbi:MAG: flagellar basal body P-ring formation chaperone FlgA, partial [Bacteroidota bacterium]|nr:flagellar basal body P-ring formation chaperone FlgA [Bacteroidota bacterium]
KKGTLSIKNSSKKQIFFNYAIDAKIDVYKARKPIMRSEELSHINCVKKSIILDKFRAMPIEIIKKGIYQSRQHIKLNKIITTRDVQTLRLAKRGTMINIFLTQENITITFSAEALKDGVYGDIIKVKQSNNRVIKVRIIGKNKGEVI